MVRRLLSPALAGERGAWDHHNRAVAQQEAGRDVLILSMGNPDSPVPRAALEGTIDAIRRGEHGYVDAAGIAPLRAAIASYQSRRCGGLAVDPSRVVVTQGCQNALYAAMASLLEEGDEVLVPNPHYVTYPTTIATTGGTCVSVATSADDGFRITAAALRRRLTPRTRAVLITTPCNPTGVCPTHDELRAIVELCNEHSLALISDEVYAGTEFDAVEHVNPASVPGGERCTISVGSCSKMLSMTGWRVGWVISPSAALCEGIVALNESMHFGLCPFVQYGAADAIANLNAEAEQRLARNAARNAARSDGGRNNAEFDDAVLDEPDPLAALYQARRDALLSGIEGSAGDDAAAAAARGVAGFRGATVERPGLVCRAPEGGIFCMVDVRRSGASDHAFAERLLERHAISVLPATAFGAAAAGHVRVGLLASEEEMHRVGGCVVDVAASFAAEGR